MMSIVIGKDAFKVTRFYYFGRSCLRQQKNAILENHLLLMHNLLPWSKSSFNGTIMLQLTLILIQCPNKSQITSVLPNRNATLTLDKDRQYFSLQWTTLNGWKQKINSHDSEVSTSEYNLDCISDINTF